MRRLTILVFILLISCGITPKAEFIGEWVAVYNWRGSQKGVGLILNFKNDKEISVGGLGSDKEMTFDYQIDKLENRLLIKNKGTYETFGYFKKASADKFTLMTPDSSETMEFRRIHETNLKLSLDQAYNTIKNSSWISKGEIDSIRIDFRATHRWDDESQPFEAMFHYWEKWPSKEKETWKLFDHKGRLFLRNTYHQSSDVIRQIREFDSNRIVLTETYDADRFAELNKKDELTDNDTHELIEVLCQNKWKSIHNDTIKSTEGGEIRTGETDILAFDDLKEQLEFRFNTNRTYSAKISTREWKNGVWDLTKDGEYIIFDDWRYKTNWVQIVRWKDGLVLSKLHKFKGGRLGYELYLFTTTLE